MKLVIPSVKYQKSYLETLVEVEGETGPMVVYWKIWLKTVKTIPSKGATG